MTLPGRPPQALRAYHIDSNYVLFVWPRGPSALEGLTHAEREVLMSVLLGRSDHQIAQSRGRSARTIANQLRAAFTKMGIRSRKELFAKVTLTDVADMEKRSEGR